MTKTFRVAAFALAAGLTLSTSALAQASATPAAVQAGTYAVEPGHARVLFAVSHMGFSTWYGDFAGAKGSLTLDPKNLAASQLEVSVPTASITTTNATLDGELKSPAWFDAAKYPTLSFRSTKVVPTGADSAQVTGDLTFHGVTRPVVLDAKFKGAGVNPLSKAYTVGFDVSGKIKRSDFGVKTYLPMIGDEVDLIISAPFERKPG